VDTRTRWIVGILLALVIGLGVGLVIVAGDDSEDSTTVTSRLPERSESSTRSPDSTGTPVAPCPADHHKWRDVGGKVAQALPTCYR
jgi:hypothetical protein